MRGGQVPRSRRSRGGRGLRFGSGGRPVLDSTSPRTGSSSPSSPHAVRTVAWPGSRGRNGGIGKPCWSSGIGAAGRPVGERPAVTSSRNASSAPRRPVTTAVRSLRSPRSRSTRRSRSGRGSVTATPRRCPEASSGPDRYPPCATVGPSTPPGPDAHPARPARRRGASERPRTLPP